jgi:hypothetical protein
VAVAEVVEEEPGTVILMPAEAEAPAWCSERAPVPAAADMAGRSANCEA